MMFQFSSVSKWFITIEGKEARIHSKIIIQPLYNHLEVKQDIEKSQSQHNNNKKEKD
jgi:hypothetical protein